MARALALLTLVACLPTASCSAAQACAHRHKRYTWGKPNRSLAFKTPDNACRAAVQRQTPTGMHIWLVATVSTRPEEKADLRHFFMTCHMFWNPALFDRLLFAIDYSEGAREASELSSWMKSQYPFPLTVDIAPLIPASAMSMFRDGWHKRPGKSYDKMQYFKLIFDLAVDRAVSQYGVQGPDVIGLIDADTYWHTLPTHATVFDDALAGALIVPGAPRQLPCCKDFFSTTQRLLNVTPMVNFMYSYPMFALKTDWAAMRKRIVAVHPAAKGQVQTFDNAIRIFWHSLTARKEMQSEVCIIWSYAIIFNKKYYSVRINPRISFFRHGEVISEQQAVRDYPESRPFIHIMVHDKALMGRRKTTVAKGCCLVFALHDSHPRCAEFTTPASHSELLERYGNASVLNEHYTHVNCQLHTLPSCLLDHYRASCLAYLERIDPEGLKWEGVARI